MFEITDEIVELGAEPKSVEENTFVEEPAKVYVKVNADGYITDVNSDKFIKDLNDWTYIDEGFSDRFVHAQNLYFEKPLIDEKGNYFYKFNV